MQVNIRPAQLSDSGAIASVIRESLGDDVAPGRILSILDRGQHTTLVAEVDGDVVGFIDGFITTTLTGNVRTELDLLGVHPGMRKLGVGTNLVREFVDIHSANGTCLIRALVSHQNYSMHRVMAHTGFVTDDRLFGLYIRDVMMSDEKATRSGHLIPVETLTYSGIWIEERFTPDAISSANALGLEVPCDIVGAVLPLSDGDTEQIATHNGFTLIGKFQWWERLA